MAAKAGTSTPNIDLGAVEDATARIRELNERIIESSKTAGVTTLDAYEKALTSLVDFEQKIAGATQLDWVSALAQTHAKFVSDVTAIYTKAAREALG
jgi:hypothetical protein